MLLRTAKTWVVQGGLAVLLTGTAAAQSPDPQPMGTGTPPATDVPGGMREGMRPEQSAPHTGQMMEEGKPAAAILAKLHHVNQTEIEHARMAKNKAQSQKVIDYATRLERDHMSADRELLAYARGRNINEAELTRMTMEGNGESAAMKKDKMAEKAAAMERLRGLSGREFEREFLTTMVTQHDKALGLLNQARDKVTDSKLKGMLGTMIPRLESHKKTAADLLKDYQTGETTPQGG